MYTEPMMMAKDERKMELKKTGEGKYKKIIIEEK